MIISAELLTQPLFLIFFFKQKTANELRISDWSSDVCSSDLQGGVRGRVSIDPTPQGLSCPGKAICGPMTRSGLRTGGQNRRIDQAGRYGLVAGFLVLGTLGVPGGCIGEAGAYVRHQIAQGATTGKRAREWCNGGGEKGGGPGGGGGT